MRRQPKNLVPIKVKIGLRPNGHADHPDWYKLPLAASEDPAHHMFGGWSYDKTSGHKDETPDSPYGMQWGMMLVTEKFADEAIAILPSLVTIMTEEEAEDFYNNKSRAHLSENSFDERALTGLKLEFDLKEILGQDTTALKKKIAKAIDPLDDTEPGIRKQMEKKWVDAKLKHGFTLK